MVGRVYTPPCVPGEPDGRGMSQAADTFVFRKSQCSVNLPELEKKQQEGNFPLVEVEMSSEDSKEEAGHHKVSMGVYVRILGESQDVWSNVGSSSRGWGWTGGMDERLTREERKIKVARGKEEQRKWSCPQTPPILLPKVSRKTIRRMARTSLARILTRNGSEKEFLQWQPGRICRKASGGM